MISVITGASAGIGAAAAAELSRRGHRVVLVGRDRRRLDEVAAGLTGPKADVLTCDFTSLEDVRALAGRLAERYERIAVLANNAGVMSTERTVTPDGHELMIQVNHLAPFVLTRTLGDRVERVVTTSSRAARSGRLDPADLSRERRRWNGWLQYGDTKQANALFTVGLAARGVAATCFHPGVIRTGFASGSLLMRVFLALPGYAKPPEHGARTLVHLATHRDGVEHQGRYFDGREPREVPATMSDPALAERLWEATLKAVG
ncbi:SDR family NAD(P)-dependent oxidoreductase [Nonomuraea rhodomycinica]|uniref:SDR family NAD(P)-dependent oxidoreductase n=1 Tax=Nonomuraea rhodomycinica TaxID=1712872 RepID=A0A7Y6IXP8_9ACTN|nr:SDR family NAD(P)-dependent oxidoreductase [Nonomuraea rhodomycinica]NUW46255.1 SDR family NAD(P)-dependent oxidoreductase [Nonomuraea rhodomycinica]